ncbi:hypothetical protein PUN28_011805 [Cardiocondyla obscurior]|uniref:Uncharacterized protein n=1 Tax=Cardiocondyla obscurior TaxID=286306 RepID=A0AAW2FLF1_9HYME
MKIGLLSSQLGIPFTIDAAASTVVNEVGVFASDLCAEGLDTSHLRGGAGSGRASCIGGATLSHRQNSSTPLYADW